MTGGLVLRLRPHEKFLVNGVVIENGARRARLRVKTHDASILRIREALHPDDVNTPAKRLYYIAQLGVIGETEEDKTRSELLTGLRDLKAAMGENLCREELDTAINCARAGEFYRVMRSLSRVIPQEAALLSLAVGGGAQRTGAAQ